MPDTLDLAFARALDDLAIRAGAASAV
jgi:hypothetical protein